MFKRLEKAFKVDYSQKANIADNVNRTCNSKSYALAGGDLDNRKTVEKEGESEEWNENVSEKDEISDEEETSHIRMGKYHCTLCPHQILLNEKSLDLHLQSKLHYKREKKWLQQSQNANEDLEVDNRGAKSTVAPSNRTKRTRNEKNKEIEKKRISKLTADQILARKKKFQRKKARRLMRKSQADAIPLPSHQ